MIGRWVHPITAEIARQDKSGPGPDDGRLWRVKDIKFSDTTRVYSGIALYSCGCEWLFGRWMPRDCPQHSRGPNLLDGVLIANLPEAR